MDNGHEELTQVFRNNSFNTALTILLTDRRLKNHIKPFILHCKLYISDTIRCAGVLLLLASAHFNKTGFTLKSLKNTHLFLSPYKFIQLIRANGINGINLIFNNPLNCSFQSSNTTDHILRNFGNWAFGNMTPITDWGQILLGKEMGTELREIGLILLEQASITDQHLDKILNYTNKLLQSLQK